MWFDVLQRRCNELNIFNNDLVKSRNLFDLSRNVLSKVINVPWVNSIHCIENLFHMRYKPLHKFHHYPSPYNIWAVIYMYTRIHMYIHKDVDVLYPAHCLAFSIYRRSCHFLPHNKSQTKYASRLNGRKLCKYLICGRENLIIYW